MKPVLDDHEFQSGVWKKLQAYLEEELAERRSHNDSRSLDAVETAFVRGQIEHIKKMLRLPTFGKPIGKLVPSLQYVPRTDDMR